MSALEKGDCLGGPAARLIEAVLQFAGRDVTKASAPPDGSDGPTVLLPISPEHRKYREIVAEIARFDGDYPPGMSEEESEPMLRALSDEAMARERKAWATPAKTLTDVLLRGEMALYNENGIMEALDDPQAYYDERSVAQLIRAVVGSSPDPGRLGSRAAQRVASP
jgi:hypothetical protein